MAKILKYIFALSVLILPLTCEAQINTDHVMTIGRNALYFEDYALSIQYFSEVINAKPYLSEPYFYRGLAKMNLEDFQGAEDDCSLSIDRNPFVASAYQVRGLSRIHLKKYAGAEEDYNKAISFDPYNIGIRHNLALCYLEEHHYAQVDTAISGILKLDPKYKAAYLMGAESALKQADTTRALANLTQAINLDSVNGDAYQARAAIYMHKMEWDKAKTDFTEAIKYMPKDVSNFLNRALINYRQLHYNETIDDYDSVIELDPNNFIAHYNRGLLRAQFGDDNRAIEDFSFVLKREPNNFMAIFNRGILRNKTGDYRGAIHDISVVLHRYPNFLAGYQFRAAAYRKIGNTTGAARDELKLMRANLDMRFGGNSWRVKAPLASKKTRRMSDKDMEKYNQMVVQDDDEPTDSIYKDKFRGKIQNNKVDIKFEPMFVLTYNEKQQEIRRSVHYYKTVDDINTKHLLPQKLIITNQEVPLNNAEIKEEFASIDKLTSEISANPKTTKYRFARAIDYYLLKDQTNAINDLNQLLTDNPRYYLGYFARAVVRWKQLDFEENDKIKDINGKVENTADIDTKNPAYNLIRDDLDRVVGLAPDFAYAYYNRGLLMCALKNYQSAMADFTQALQIDPKMGEAYFNRGLANAFNGDKDKGISDLSKAGELGVIEAYNVIKRLSR